MLKRSAIKFAFILLTMACAFMEATPARATMTQRCNWGISPHAPTVNQWPNSTQVMMMPTVMDFGSPPFNKSQVAFISFETASQLNGDGGGVLRIIDGNCNEIARFPDLSLPPPAIPPFCPLNLNTVPDLGPTSGLAVGNLENNTTDVEIIGVIGGGPTLINKQIIAFNLVGPLTAARLVPKWCSPPLGPPDFIVGSSAPAIAQLDRPPNAAAGQSEIIIDNKVFEFNGALRYSGGGGPRSRTAVVAHPFVGIMPWVITGRGAYKSNVQGFWTGMLAWQNPAVTNGPLVFPAVAELDPSPGPEIVVVDTMARTLRVLSMFGTTLASLTIPSPSFNHCGGAPMIGNADGIPGPEIGVAGCNRYTLFKYSPGNPATLSVLWMMPTYDPSGQTTSTLYNTPNGARIYYADTTNLQVFNGVNGQLLDSVPNSSGTLIEGPVIASFGPPYPASGTVIVGANNYLGGTHMGVRIFDDPALGSSRSFWNQHTYHATNVTNSFGAIPTVEPASWLTPARNTYRVQQP